MKFIVYNLIPLNDILFESQLFYNNREKVQQCLLYAEMGSVLISVLTEFLHFKGSVSYVQPINKNLLYRYFVRYEESSCRSSK